MKHLFALKVINFTTLIFSFSLLYSEIKEEEFNVFIEKSREKYHVPGAVVVIVKEDKIVFLNGYGVRNLESEDKVDGDTIFSLASISKAITASAFAIQVDQKKIDWDVEVTQHLSDFVLSDRYASRFATPRDLFAHRTGLPAFGGDLLGYLGLSPSQILYQIQFLEPATSFREKGLYSNIGYFLAGELLSKIAGDSIEKVIKETVFVPLKMTRSGFSENLENSNVAFAHALVNGKVKVIERNYKGVFNAAGGVTSTANDVANFMIMHSNKGVFAGKQMIKADSIHELHKPSMVSEISFTTLPPINEKSSLSYAMGWINYNYNGHVIVEKGGALDGVRTIITLIPDQKMGIAIFANLNLTILPEVIRAKFLELELSQTNEDFENIFKRHSQDIDELVAEPSKPQDSLPMGHHIELYQGEFNNKLYGDVKVTKENDRLILLAGKTNYKGSLIHWSNDSFLLKWAPLNFGYELVTFTFGPDGNAIDIQTETLGILKISDKS